MVELIKKNPDQGVRKQLLIKKIISINKEYVLDAIVELIKITSFKYEDFKTLIHCILVRDYDEVLNRYFECSSLIESVLVNKDNLKLSRFFAEQPLILKNSKIN